MTSTDQLLRDLRHGFHVLRKNAAFTLAAVLTLGVAMGVTTAAFTQIYAVFLKELPVQRPSELRVFSSIDPRRPRPVLTMSSTDYRFLRDSTQTLSGLACWNTTDQQPMSEHGALNVQFVSANYLGVLGVFLRIGRSFSDDDDHAGAAPVVLLSDRVWRRDFAADPAVVGRTLTIQRQPLTIIGVLPPEFFGVSPEAAHDVLVPHALAPLIRPTSDAFCQVFGRLRPGVTTAQAQSEIARLYRDSPARPASQPRGDLRVMLSPVTAGAGAAGLRERTAPPLGVLMAISVLVLITACVNVGGLLLVRGAARAQEIGTRLALGASRVAIVRQLLTENLLLAFGAGALGLALAYAIAPIVPRFIAEIGGVATLTGEARTLGLDAHPDGRILVFCLALIAVTGLVFGALPALLSSRIDPLRLMRPPTSSIRERRFGGGVLLIVVQVALSMILIVGVVLFTNTLVRLEAVPIGYRPDGMLFATLNPIKRPRAFVDDTIRQLRALPGVQIVAASQWPLFNNAEPKLPVCIPGSESLRQALDIEWATPQFFDAWGVRLLDGRDFTPANPATAIVNRTFAERIFPGRRASGQTIGIGECPGRAVTIVGVVADHRDRPRTPIAPMVYLPYPEERAFNPTTIAVRVAGDARPFVPEVRRVISRLESSLMDGDVTTGVDYRNARVRRESLLASLFGIFGITALTISCVGVYATTAYAVARRQREISVRAALGARRPHLLAAVLGQYSVAVAIGVVGGAAVALAVSRIVDTLLFRVSAFDSSSLGAAAAVVAASAAIAAMRPGLRAARINPIDALRCE